MRAWYALVLAAAFVAIAPAAEAQGKHDPGSLAASLTGEARAAYEEARVYFTKGDYEKSLAAIERAQKASPDPRLFWNMAACEKKLGRYAKAIRHVERYLSGSSTLLREDERKEAERFLAAARTLVATVTVTSNVDGTDVVVDGELLGTTPLPKPLVVDEGAHDVRFSRPTYLTVDRRENVAAGADVRWVVELAGERPVATPRSSSTEGGHVPFGKRLGPILLGGAGLALAATGGVLVGITLHRASEVEAECGTSCPPSRWERYRSEQVVGDVLLGVGAAALVASVVWWVLQSPSTSAPTRSSRSGDPAWLSARGLRP